MNRFWEKPQKPLFQAVLSQNRPRNFFLSKIDLRHMRGFKANYLCAKNQKKIMNQFWENPKNLFFRPFLAKIGRENFFSKIRLRYILAITILHLCAKN